MSGGRDDEPELGWVRHAQILLAQETGIDVDEGAIEVDLDGRITIDTGISMVSVWPGIGGKWCGSIAARSEICAYRDSRMEALLAACRLHEAALRPA